MFEKLFEDLPEQDQRINYQKQAKLLQVCNLALLDEVKRLEDDVREKNLRYSKNMILETNPEERYLLYPPHEENHRQFKMFSFEKAGNTT